MKLILIPIITSILLGCQTPENRKPDAEPANEVPEATTLLHPANYQLHCDTIDHSQAQQIEAYLQLGQKSILELFQMEFISPFNVYVFADRESLDAQWQQDWDMPGFKSECWMVASGVSHRLDVLSPRVWDSQACEHNMKDQTSTQNLITHELIHVFHGQYNPSPNFEHIENIDWLVEGIAVYVSGQLDQDRYERAKASVIAGEAPSRLADVWKGEHRYGYAGSLAKFIHDEYGRDQFVSLLALTTATQVLNALNTTDEELIRRWKASFYTDQNKIL